MQDSFCFIPAKLGSNRLKEKNIAKLQGKELIGYSIDAAKNSELFYDEVIVSSESDKVLQIARGFGAKTPYTREKKLASDPFGVKDVLLDFLIRNPEYQKFKYTCVLLPTAPLLSETDIKACYKLLSQSTADLVLSVCETNHNAFRSVEIENERLKPLFPESIAKKTQELPSTYRINGAVIFLKTEIFLEKKSFFTTNVGTCIMPASRSVDIDSLNDLNYAEFLIKNNPGED